MIPSIYLHTLLSITHTDIGERYTNIDKADKWMNLLKTTPGVAIPKEISGATDTEKQANYAALTSVVNTKQAEAILEFFRRAEEAVE